MNYSTQGTELVNEDSEQKGLNKNGLIRPKNVQKKYGGNPAGVEEIGTRQNYKQRSQRPRNIMLLHIL